MPQNRTAERVSCNAKTEQFAFTVVIPHTMSRTASANVCMRFRMQPMRCARAERRSLSSRTAVPTRSQKSPRHTARCSGSGSAIFCASADLTKRWDTLKRARPVTSSRKFDQFGDWYLIRNRKLTKQIFTGRDRKAADSFYYHVR